MSREKCKRCSSIVHDSDMRAEYIEAENRNVLICPKCYEMKKRLKLIDMMETIDLWYIEWKEKFPNVPHPLGFAKEDLKRRMECKK